MYLENRQPDLVSKNNLFSVFFTSFILQVTGFYDALLAASPVRHHEGADLFKDDCAFIRQGFFRATMCEWQVPVRLD